MKNIRKILAVILCLATLMTVCVPFASAEELAEDTTQITQETPETETPEEEETETPEESEEDTVIPDEPEEEDSGDYRIEREKRFLVEPMTEQEAILQMELLGHTFFLFKNSETNEINVVYRRNDGAYGLLIPIE